MAELLGVDTGCERRSATLMVPHCVPLAIALTAAAWIETLQAVLPAVAEMQLSAGASHYRTQTDRPGGLARDESDP
jgi:hypothetical protein